MRKLFISDIINETPKDFERTYSYYEAMSYIRTKGMPDFIIFNYEKKDDNFTGVDLVKWLMHYDLDNDVIRPDFDFDVHSTDALNTKKITNLLRNYLFFKRSVKYEEEEKLSSIEILKKCKEELENTTQEEFDRICKERGIDELDDIPDEHYTSGDFKLVCDECIDGQSIADYYNIKEMIKISKKIEDMKNKNEEIKILQLPENWDIDVIIVPKKHTNHISCIIQSMIKTKEIYPNLGFEYIPLSPKELKELTIEKASFKEKPYNWRIKDD